MCIKNCQYTAVLVVYLLLSGFSYAEPLTGKIVVVDPGHGAKNSAGKIINYGCKGSLGTKESDIVVDISEVLGDMLLQNGSAVYFTRDRKNYWRSAESQDADNQSRAEFANSKNADIFLRVHCNWSPDKKKRGVSVLWYKNDSEKFAKTVYEEIKKSGVIVDGVHRQHLVGFEFAEVPAILVEYGYLSNKEDEKLLKDKRYIEKISRAIISRFEKNFSMKDMGDDMLEKITWLGQSGFKILADKVIYFDPWEIGGQQEKADLIFITHGHHDHCSPEDIKKLTKDTTKIIASVSCKGQIAGNVEYVKPGDKLTVDGIQFEAVPAYNINKSFHPKSANNVGFIVNIGGKRIYHAGDTDLIPEMKEIKCDIAFLPISGTYVMTAQEAVKAAELIKPEIAIPMHYGSIVGSKKDAEEFAKGYTGRTVILEKK